VGGAVLSLVIGRMFISSDIRGESASAQVVLLVAMLFLGAWIGSKIGRAIGDGFEPMPPSSATTRRL
jgi:hypothetical protein